MGVVIYMATFRSLNYLNLHWQRIFKRFVFRLQHDCLKSDVYYKASMTVPEILINNGCTAQLIKTKTSHNRMSLDVLCNDKSQFDYIKVQNLLDKEKECDDPFYVMNINQLINRHKLWIRSFPNIKPYCAVKTNDDSVFLSLLANLGTGFDCASKKEIQQILELGVKPDDVIFANTCKQMSHLKYASEKGISLMTFDNETELHKISAEHSNAKLLIRIRADDPTAIATLGTKFGCSLSEACDLLHTAKSLKLNVIGVSFHVGYGCQTPLAYRTAIEMSHKVFEYASSVGYHFTMLDIGGGYPGIERELHLFEKIAHVVNTSIDELFSNRDDLKLIAEPGQYYSASCFSLVVQVTSKKQSSDGVYHYYINDGVYGSFNIVTHGCFSMEPQPLQITTGAPIYQSILWGPTCDGADKVGHTMLPELSVGDCIVFEEFGAYTMAVHSNFNGFYRPKVLYISK